MECPFCHKNISENTLKCPHCQNIVVEYKPILFSSNDAITKISKDILSGKQIFSVTGDEKIDKFKIIIDVAKNLSEYDFIWLLGKCTSLTQLEPVGLIKDVLFNLFNLPNFVVYSNDFENDVCEFIKKEIPRIDDEEREILLNLLYPTENAELTDVIENKKQVNNILLKVFERVSRMGKFVIAVDNFDLIDKFSYDFLNILVNDEKISNNLHLIITSNIEKPVESYFPSDNDLKYSDVTLSALSSEELKNFLDSYGEVFSYINDDEKSEIILKSRGYPIFIEQALSYCFDCQISENVFDLPENFEDVISKRLNILKSVNNLAYKILLTAAILGDKIIVPILKEIIADDEFDAAVEYLLQMQFIQKFNDKFYEFKNTYLLETILNVSKNDEIFSEIYEKIKTFSTRSVKNFEIIFAIIYEKEKNFEFAIDYWVRNAKIAVNLGDINLSILSYKQCLAFIGELADDKYNAKEFEIKENLGKLLTNFNPKEAIEYLSDVITYLKTTENNVRKEIELLGYLANCCLKTNNNFGNIECVDKVLQIAPKDDRLSLALLATTKLRALLNVGNCGEVVNLIDNEIMPVLDKYFVKHKKTDILYEFVYETWLNTYLILANALILQGDSRSFEILTIIFDIIEKHHIDDKVYICKSKIALAFANIIKGDFKVSVKILNDVINLFADKINDREIIVDYNFVRCLGNFLTENITKEELFDLTVLADDCGNSFIKNISKTLFGKVVFDEGNIEQATNIYNEQIIYFANEKNALGALLNWYLIAELNLKTDKIDEAIEVAQKSLEVAQNPQINNYLFRILFKMILARAFMEMKDYNASKIYLEKSLNLAMKFDLTDILSKVYFLYGNYYLNMLNSKTVNREQYLRQIILMYDKAHELTYYTQNVKLKNKIDEEKQRLLKDG